MAQTCSHALVGRTSRKATKGNNLAHLPLTKDVLLTSVPYRINEIAFFKSVVKGKSHASVDFDSGISVMFDFGHC